MTSNSDTAVVFDIQRFSIHDGPGIRTLIFFKGCSLRCAWCQNPEAVRPEPEIAFYADRCIRCGGSATICRHGAVTSGPPPVLDWSLCTDCGECVDECPAEVFRLVGQRYTVDELLDACSRDRSFYEESGGGVTLSGGEPVLHSGFLERFLPTLKSRGVHVLLETAGHYKFGLLEPLLPHIDEIFFDVKLGDSASHRRHTGQRNDRILQNLGILQDLQIPLTVRVPMIPGLNTEPDQIAAISGALTSLGVERVVLLTYNHLWEVKLSRLRTSQRVLGIADDHLDYESLRQTFLSLGLLATLAD